MSISEKVVPDDMKVARVKPILWHCCVSFKYMYYKINLLYNTQENTYRYIDIFRLCTRTSQSENSICKDQKIPQCLQRSVLF